MAFAKEMTIATGHTVRVNGDEHEIKVSLTYELERDDHDVLLLVAVKAAEVQNAHKAACQQMHSRWTQRESFTDEDAPPAQEDEDLEDEFGEEGEPPATTIPVSFQPPPPAPAMNGQTVNTVGRGNGFGKPAASKSVTPTEEQADKPASPGEEPCTTPQKIAIRSLAKQAGLDDAHLRDFLWDTFGTFRLEKLSKYQAARLMLAFKDGTWKSGIPGVKTVPQSNGSHNAATTIH